MSFREKLITSLRGKPEEKAVTILGFFTDRLEAPIGNVLGGHPPDDGAEVWGLNQLYQYYHHDEPLAWSRWFEMHALDFLKNWNPRYVEWLAAQDRGPIYMQEHYPEIPRSVAFPRDEINADLGKRYGFSHDYFTSSFSYMLALAIHERFQVVGLYGMGFILDGEAQYERPGLEYLIGIAQGSGMKVTLGSTSLLLKIHYVYGYTEPRMKLEHVGPVMDYLKQSAAVMKQRADRIDQWLKVHPVDDTIEPEAAAARVRLITEMNNCDAVKANLEGQVHWLKHYARGGCLIAPDGTLTKE